MAEENGDTEQIIGDVSEPDISDPEVAAPDHVAVPDNVKITFKDLGIPGANLTESPFGLGTRRTFDDLQKKELVFIVVAGLSLLATLAITIEKLATLPKTSTDFSFALVLLLNTVFGIWYLVEGLLLERPHEILVLSISTIVVWFYIILNFALGTRDVVKMVRLIMVSALSPFIAVLGVLIARHYFDSGHLIFRTVGAQSFMQSMCRMMFGFFGYLKFDLQLSWSMVILVLTQGQTLTEKVILSVGIVVVLGCALLGYLSVRLEKNVLSIIFSCTLIIQPIYIGYKVEQSLEHFSSANDNIAVPTIICALASVTIRFIMVYFFIRSWLNYDKGLKEKVFPSHLQDNQAQQANTGVQ